MSQFCIEHDMTPWFAGEIEAMDDHTALDQLMQALSSFAGRVARSNDPQVQEVAHELQMNLRAIRQTRKTVTARGSLVNVYK